MCGAFGRKVRRALDGECRLWAVWWIAGAALCGAVGLLVVGAETLRDSGSHELAAAVDLLRFAVFAVWVRAAWKCSRNVSSRFWTPLARAAIAISVVGMSVLY